MRRHLLIWLALTSFSLSTRDLVAQFGGGISPTKPPEIGEPDANGGRMVTFRTFVPTEYAVHLLSPDLYPQSFNLGAQTTRMESPAVSHWEKTIGPLPPGVYHYRFTCFAMSGLNLDDEDYATKGWNQLVLPGDTLLEMRDVPHGMVADITYYIPIQKRFDHLHIYLPPGYEKGDGDYPVLYLLGDGKSLLEICRLNMMLDNLIATGKAQPMIVVVSRSPDSVYIEANILNDEVRPYVEKNYRVRNGQANRAIAGGKSLDIAFQDINEYAYIAPLGGWIPHISDPEQTPWEEHFQEALTDAAAKPDIRLILLNCQKDSELKSSVAETGLLLSKYGFSVELYESEKQNGWAVYQDYLSNLLPRLFQPEKK